MYRWIGVIFLILTFLMATACSSAAATPDRIAKSMGEERRTEAAIAPDDPSVAGNEFGEGKQPFRDDLWEYIYDPEGYLNCCIRIDRGADTDSGKSTSELEKKTRAVELHLRNFSRKQTGEVEVKRITSGMGDTIYEIIEMKGENPTGRKSSVHFTKEGVLVSLVSYCRPITPLDPSVTGNLSEEQAARIAFDDLLWRLGSVLTVQVFEDAHWSAEKTTTEGRLAWKITIDQLVRTDFPPVIKSWSVQYWIDVTTGEIILRAEAA
ncbi:MAG: hypothetical protein GX153_02610 [Clostridiaceae bacterium]|nr:hypothetical protein [Clostridiaceae bacterium]